MALVAYLNIALNTALNIIFKVTTIGGTGILYYREVKEAKHNIFGQEDTWDNGSDNNYGRKIRVLEKIGRVAIISRELLIY